MIQPFGGASGEGQYHPAGLVGTVDASCVRWCASHTGLAIDLVSARLRYLVAPSQPLPLALEVGVVPITKVDFERLDFVRSDFGLALEACGTAHVKLAYLLRGTDRGDPSYKSSLDKCISHILLVPAENIPHELQDMLYEFDHAKVALLPFEHGRSIPATDPLTSRPLPSRLASIPQCDSEIYVDWWLDMVDSKLSQITECHRGALPRRPEPIFAGLECILPHLRPFRRRWFS